MTDDAGNTASASTGFELDTTADLEDGAVVGVTVDSVINDTESGNVSLTLSGVDGDAASVTVTLTDSEGTETTATASDGNNGTWTVDVSNDALKDGNISVAVAVTDDAGNTASASTGFELDTVVLPPVIIQVAETHNDRQRTRQIPRSASRSRPAPSGRRHSPEATTRRGRCPDTEAGRA